MVWKGAKGIPTKGIAESYEFRGICRAFLGRFQGIFRVFLGSFRVFSGCFPYFRAISGYFQGVFSVFSGSPGCCQGVFPYALSGTPFEPFQSMGPTFMGAEIWEGDERRRSLRATPPPPSDFLPLRHAIFPSQHRENGHFEANPLRMLQNGHFPCVAWEKSHVAGGRKSGLTN